MLLDNRKARPSPRCRQWRLQRPLRESEPDRASFGAPAPRRGPAARKSRERAAWPSQSRSDVPRSDERFPRSFARDSAFQDRPRNGYNPPLPRSRFASGGSLDPDPDLQPLAPPPAVAAPGRPGQQWSYSLRCRFGRQERASCRDRTRALIRRPPCQADGRPRQTHARSPRRDPESPRHERGHVRREHERAPRRQPRARPLHSPANSSRCACAGARPILKTAMAAPNPLSTLTTVTPEAQPVNIEHSAVIPEKATP